MVYMFKKDIWCICFKKDMVYMFTERLLWCICLSNKQYGVYVYMKDYMVYLCFKKDMVYMFTDN